MTELPITEPGIVSDISPAAEVPDVTVDVEPGYTARIDLADLPLVAKFVWRGLHGHNGKVYAVASGKPLVYMHRLIVGTTAKLETDHRNGDGLDNRRVNLRPATASQNRANMWKPRRPDGRPTSSIYKGVSWDKARGKWQSKISHFDVTTGRTRTYNLGRYESEVAAGAAYDKAATARWGPFARLNFPPSVEAIPCQR